MSAVPKESSSIQQARDMLLNWAYWAAENQGNIGHALSVINRLYTPPLGSVWDENYKGSIPIDALEAAHTNDLIMQLRAEYQQVIYLRYLRKGTIDYEVKRAKALGLIRFSHRDTFYRQLDKAERAFSYLIN